MTTDELARPGGVLDESAAEYRVTPAATRAGVVAPALTHDTADPGTKSVHRAEESIAAASIGLSDEQYHRLLAASS